MDSSSRDNWSFICDIYKIDSFDFFPLSIFLSFFFSSCFFPFSLGFPFSSVTFFKLTNCFFNFFQIVFFLLSCLLQLLSFHFLVFLNSAISERVMILSLSWWNHFEGLDTHDDVSFQLWFEQVNFEWWDEKRKKILSCNFSAWSNVNKVSSLLWKKLSFPLYFFLYKSFHSITQKMWATRFFKNVWRRRIREESEWCTSLHERWEWNVWLIQVRSTRWPCLTHFSLLPYFLLLSTSLLALTLLSLSVPYTKHKPYYPVLKKLRENLCVKKKERTCERKENLSDRKRGKSCEKKESWSDPTLT